MFPIYCSRWLRCITFLFQNTIYRCNPCTLWSLSFSFWDRFCFPHLSYLLVSLILLMSPNHFCCFGSINCNAGCISNSSLMFWFLILFRLVAPFTILKCFIYIAWILFFCFLVKTHASVPIVNVGIYTAFNNLILVILKPSLFQIELLFKVL